MTAGLVAAFAASTAYFAYYQHLDPIPQPLVVGRRVAALLRPARHRPVPAAPHPGAAPAVQPLPRRPDRRPDRRRAGRDLRPGRRGPARRRRHRDADGGLPGRRPAAPGPGGRRARHPRRPRRMVLVAALRVVRGLLRDRRRLRRSGRAGRLRRRRAGRRRVAPGPPAAGRRGAGLAALGGVANGEPGGRQRPGPARGLRARRPRPALRRHPSRDHAVRVGRRRCAPACSWSGARR